MVWSFSDVRLLGVAAQRRQLRCSLQPSELCYRPPRRYAMPIAEAACAGTRGSYTSMGNSGIKRWRTTRSVVFLRVLGERRCMQSQGCDV
eukprot:591675-Rhodomonas_salina.1